MLKLYFLYLVLGGYLLLESYSMWSLSSFSHGDNIITYAALLSSAILFVLAPAIALHNLKRGAIVGLMALGGTFPFGMHWLIYRYNYEAPLITGTYNQIVLMATLLYLVAVVCSIIYATRRGRSEQNIQLKTPVIRALSLTPVFLLFIFVALCFINP